MATYSPEKLGIKAPAGGFKVGGWYKSRQYWGGTLSEPGQIHPSSDQPGAGKDVSKEVVQQTDPANWEYIQQQKQQQQPQQQRPQQQPKAEGEVTPYLNKFQGDLFKAIESPEVKVPTMGELKEELAPGAAYPDPLKRVEERARLTEELGVAGLEASSADIKAQIDEEFALLREQRGIEEGKPVPMGVISGRISEEERTAQQRIDFLGRQQARINDELNTKYAIIGQTMQDLGLDYGDAVVRYDSEYKRNVEMYNIISGKEEAALTQLERDRTAARSNLQIYTNAITSGNLTYGDMSTDQKLMVNKLEVQSGLPIGFIGSLKMSAKDRLLSVNDKTGEALMIDQGGNFNVVQTGMRPTPVTGTASEKAEGKLKGAYSDAESWLREKGGDDLFVSPDEWKYIRSIWARQGYDVEDFDDAFRERFVGRSDERGFDITQFGYEE